MLNYLDEYYDKYGFSSGEMTPPDAVAFRRVVYKVLNRLLIREGSQVRVVPFNSPGSRNYIMLQNVIISYYADRVHDNGDIDDIEDWIPEHAMAAEDAAYRRSVQLLSDIEHEGMLLGDLLEIKVVTDEETLQAMMDRIDEGEFQLTEEEQIDG